MIDRKRATIKALNMKAAAIEAILNGAEGLKRKKTMEFIEIPHDKLVERIQSGEFKLWKRKN